jgi:dolichol-phosphate mannosyltransferase
VRTSFSLIIPTYDEKDNIPILLNRLRDTLGNKKDIEIIVVDDDSPDLTWQVAEEYSRKDSRVRVIRRMQDKGLSKAVIEGFNSATGDILGVMDADLSHDHKILPQMISTVQNEGYDLVVGSRRIPGGGADKWPWYRKLTSNFATLLAKIFLNIELSDPMSGYFTMKKDLFEGAKDNINPKGYKILLEIYVRANPSRVKEIPFVFKDRNQGYSKMTTKVMLEYIHMLFNLRFR